MVLVLVAAGCEPVFVEKAGRLARRPAYPACRPGLREHPHDPGRARRAGWARAGPSVADRRGLTPLFWAHLLPYGELRLDMTPRLALGAVGIG